MQTDLVCYNRFKRTESSRTWEACGVMIDEKDIAEIVLQKYSSIYARLVSVARRFGHTALVDQVEDCIQDALMLLYEKGGV